MYPRRQFDVSNLVTQADDAPRLAGLVDGLDDADVERLSLAEDFVEAHLAQLRSHRRLRQLCDGKLRIFHAVRRVVRVQDPQVQNAVYAERDVVGSDRRLFRNI